MVLSSPLLAGWYIWLERSDWKKAKPISVFENNNTIIIWKGNTRQFSISISIQAVKIKQIPIRKLNRREFLLSFQHQPINWPINKHQRIMKEQKPYTPMTSNGNQKTNKTIWFCYSASAVAGSALWCSNVDVSGCLDPLDISNSFMDLCCKIGLLLQHIMYIVMSIKCIMFMCYSVCVCVLTNIYT